MKNIHDIAFRGLACSVSILAMAVAAPAFAQAASDTSADACELARQAGDPLPEGCVRAEEPSGIDVVGPPDQVDPEVTPNRVGQPANADAIIVTGSRIRRDTYSSISPLQVLSSETQNEVGLFDPSQILQRSPAAAGQQIDATFQGFVLNNGPGSQTVRRRGQI